MFRQKKLYVKNIQTSIYTVYSTEADITFIMQDIFDGSTKECISTEVKGFYYGEPNDNLTTEYNGKLKAEF